VTPTAQIKFLLAPLTAVLALATQPANAQARTMAEIANYQGPDRTAKLIAGAKKEGTVSIYGATVPRDMNPVLNAFKKKYGVNVQYWRAASELVLQRTISEHRAGRCAVDTYSTVVTELEAAHREKLLERIKSPLTAALIPQAVPAHGEWVAVRLNIYAAGYNTNLVKKSELPKSYEDLKNPRWKGRLAVEANDVEWFAALVTKMGFDKGVKLIKDIVHTNGLTPRKGHTVLSNLVAAGEIPMALTLYSYKPEQMKHKGAPIGVLYLPPVVALGYGTAVDKCAPHPNAAVLFYDFLIEQAQKIWAKRFMAPTNPKIAPLPNGGDIVLSDPKELIDHRAKWDALWDSTVINPR
jgi:ABC-type Fe3+ transport system substrate-binding protein